MKQKLLLLLTALMLLTTGNAWGDVPTYTWDFTNTTTWTTAKISTGSAVTYDQNGVASGADGYSGYGVTFKFNAEKGAVKWNAASKSVSGTGIWFYENGNATSNCVSITVPADFKVTFNFIGGNLGGRPFVTSTDGGSTSQNQTSSPYQYTNETGSDVIVTMWVSNCLNGSGVSQNCINNIVLEDFSAASATTCTVHFQDEEGTAIKDDVIINTVVGATVNADAYLSDIYANEKKYVYKSGNTPITVVADASSNVITLVFDEYSSTAYTVKAQVSGTDLTTLASGTTYFDGSTTVYWNKYINVNDQWYIADGTTYGKAITTATNNVAFTAVDDIDYFFEAENMTYSRTYNTYSGTAASNGSAKTLYGDANAQTTSTVSRGKYNISISGIKWGDNSDTYQIAYSTDKANWIALGTVTYATGTEGVRTLENVIIPAESYIRIWATMGSQTPRRYLDYIILDRTQEYTDVEIAILDCKKYETSAAFATAIDAESFSTAEEVYAFHTAWQIENASSDEITKVIRNAAIDATGLDWTNARIWSGEKYTGAPDEYYLDQYQNTLDAYQTIYGLPAGSYKVKAATRGSVGASGNIYVYAEGQVDKNAEINHNGNEGGTLGQGWSWTEVEFTLTATSDVKIGFWCNASASGQWAGCDDFHLYAEGVPASLGTNGYATFASPYALNLANLPEGLTAYKAAVEETTVTFTQVTDAVQANTGLLLKGTASGNYNIPVATSGADISATNAFLVNEGGKTFNADDNFNYFGLKKNTLTFGLFNPATVAIPSNKAYLKIANSGARLTIVFEDDDPTAINTVEAAESEADALKDGKYLINGKIVIVKNGVKYSANGQILK